MSIVSVYVASVKLAKSAVVPYTGAMLEGLASRPTIELMLAYSIVPMDASGKLAKSDKAIAYVAMPHVLARATDNAGEPTMRAMRAAGFGSAGFAGKDSTPASRAKAASTLADKLASLIPQASKPQASKPQASKPQASKPQASKPQASKSAAIAPATPPVVDAPIEA